MQSQKILQQQALSEVQQYKSGWSSAEATRSSVLALLAEAATQWQGFSEQRTIKSPADEEASAALDAAFSKAVKHYQDWIGFVGDDALLIKILNDSSINNEFKQQIAPLLLWLNSLFSSKPPAALCLALRPCIKPASNYIRAPVSRRRRQKSSPRWPRS